MIIKRHLIQKIYCNNISSLYALQTVHEVDGNRIRNEDYATVFSHDLDHDIDPEFLQCLRDNNIGFKTVPEILADTSLPIHEVIMDRLMNSNKVTIACLRNDLLVILLRTHSILNAIGEISYNSDCSQKIVVDSYHNLNLNINN